MDIDKFYSYKDINSDMLPDMRNLANDMSYNKHNKNNRRHPNNNYNNNNNNNNYNNKFKNDIRNVPSVLMKPGRNDKKKFFIEMNGLLSKITDNNFEDISNDIFDKNIDTEEKKTILIEQIFKKAINENKFCDIYAKLCIDIMNKFDAPSKTSFKHNMLNKCQCMFMDAIESPIFEEVTEISISADQEIPEVKSSFFKNKNMILGCMGFIGCLYLQSMLTTKIIDNCFTTMFSQFENEKYYTVDCMCALMIVIGNKYSKESPNAKQTFDNIDNLKNDESVSVKEKFVLMDLAEKRQKLKWA